MVDVPQRLVLACRLHDELAEAEQAAREGALEAHVGHLVSGIIATFLVSSPDVAGSGARSTTKKSTAQLTAYQIIRTNSTSHTSQTTMRRAMALQDGRREHARHDQPAKGQHGWGRSGRLGAAAR